ncbi:glycosyl transferase family protein [Marinobacter lipolyticus SM19]|uniref:Glycosyl transferase family protein n=1 Tax=Marinobacter lipolyticus SM19 TaxID=1318628 RepID=R8B5W0_9GAMM|nr:glycosyl transferase family protein [Marinobacter lipolyticus SM19]
MCTYYGDSFLPAQLDSIDRQSYPNIELWVSDDGGDSGTQEILRDFQVYFRPRNMRVLRGPGKGFVANFMSQLMNPAIDAEYFALSDQDDVWEKDKVAVAIDALSSVPDEKPAVYCSRTRLIDESGNDIGYSPLFSKQPSFRNALIQSIAGGNTMVLNRSARDMLIAANQSEVVCHDWWIYLLITGAGGTVIYDSNSKIGYRQHGRNLIGSGGGWVDRVKRGLMLMADRHRQWNRVNLKALSQTRALLTEENCRLCDEMAALGQKGWVGRLAFIRRAGLYRQTRLGTVSLYIAALFNKL